MFSGFFRPRVYAVLFFYFVGVLGGGLNVLGLWAFVFFRVYVIRGAGVLFFSPQGLAGFLGRVWWLPTTALPEQSVLPFFQRGGVLH